MFKNGKLFKVVYCYSAINKMNTKGWISVLILIYFSNCDIIDTGFMILPSTFPCMEGVDPF